MAANLYASAQNAVCTFVVRTAWDQKSINDLVSDTPSAGSPMGGLGADAWSYAQSISDFFGKISGGELSASIEYSDGLVTGVASATGTLSGLPSNNDTITIAGVTITFKTSGATGSQINIATTVAGMITAIVAFINANGSNNNLLGYVNAVATSGTVFTLYSDYPGLVGNLITFAKSCANLTITGGGNLTGGALLTQSPISTVGA